MSEPVEPCEYFLEFCEATWQLYTRRGSKGRTKQGVKCDSDFAALRSHALKVAAANKRGAVLTIYRPDGRREVHDFPPAAADIRP